MSYRHELDLLTACALPPAHHQISSRVRSLAGGPMDWSRLCALAGYHRVEPLLYTRLAEHAGDMVPDSLLAKLASDFRAGAARNLQFTGELIALTKAFAAAGIAVLPHKGPLLAQAAYGNLAMREFADLDLLVHPSDLPRAIALLAELDYRAAEDLAWLSPSALLRWTGEMSYTSPRGASVDLHWRLTPSHYTVQLDPKILWRSRASVTIGGTEIPTLSPAALLLLLAVHGAKHCWESLGWLADVAWLGAAHPEAWQGAMNLASETHCQRPVALARSLTELVFQGKPAHDPLCRRVLDRWYNHPPESPRSPELLSFAASLAERPTATLHHLFGLLLYPTEIDWKTRRLPEGLFWLYAPARVVRLVGKYLLSAPAANAIQ